MHSLDQIALVIFALVQWRITVLWLRSARGRFSGGRLFAVRVAIFLLDFLVALGWTLDVLTVTGRPLISGRTALFLSSGALAYCMGATAVFFTRLLFQVLQKQLKTEFHPGRRRVLSVAGNLAVAAPFAAMAYGSLIERLNFQVREVDIPIPGLPKDLDGLRVLHLSDIHLSAFLSESQLERVIDAANGTRPHLAVVTGDLISSRSDPLDACIRQLARLKTDAGVFACMGNHERFSHVEDDAAWAGLRAGIPFLRQENRQLRFGSATMNIAGVDYQPLQLKDSYLVGAERLLTPGACNILLSHNPDVFPVAARQGYNLMLAGHTHGGQVSVEILDQSLNPARFLTPYVYGLYRSGTSAAYVTRGIGTIGIPARIGAPPETSVLRLRKA